LVQRYSRFGLRETEEKEEPSQSSIYMMTTTLTLIVLPYFADEYRRVSLLPEKNRVVGVGGSEDIEF
jgi:hypothetical protein